MDTPTRASRKLRVLISAGEASGEMYGAALLDSLRRQAAGRGFSGVDCFGLGGHQMRLAGCDTTVDANSVAVVGLAEVVRHLPNIYREFHKLVREIERRKPDVAVLIDFPDWNLRLAKELHKRGVPVVYYVSPQLWAWRKGRLKQVQKYIKKMLVIFPFEKEFYAKNGVAAEFVGHPLSELERPRISREEYAAKYGLDPHKDWIALLPGSRRGEVSRHFEEMLKAAELIEPNAGNIEKCKYLFILPVASSLKKEDIAGVNVSNSRFISQVRVKFVDDAREALAHSRAAVVASGTATVETALMGVPFVMVYRLSQLTYSLGKHLVDVPHYGMVNLIAGRRVVPELIQQDFTAERVVAELRPLLADGAAREQMVQALSEVRQRLHGGASGTAAENAANAVLSVVTV